MKQRKLLLASTVKLFLCTQQKANTFPSRMWATDDVARSQTQQKNNIINTIPKYQADKNVRIIHYSYSDIWFSNRLLHKENTWLKKNSFPGLRTLLRAVVLHYSYGLD